ncbi:unnamed protein product [Lota lota]
MIPSGPVNQDVVGEAGGWTLQCSEPGDYVPAVCPEPGYPVPCTLQGTVDVGGRDGKQHDGSSLFSEVPIRGAMFLLLNAAGCGPPAGVPPDPQAPGGQRRTRAGSPGQYGTLKFKHLTHIPAGRRRANGIKPAELNLRSAFEQHPLWGRDVKATPGRADVILAGDSDGTLTHRVHNTDTDAMATDTGAPWSTSNSQQSPLSRARLSGHL